MLLILPANVDGTRWGLDSKTQLGVEMSKVFFQLTLVKNIGILSVIWVSRLQNPISPLCFLEGKVWALSMLKRFERTFQWSNGDHMLQDCTHLTIQFQSPVILQTINCYYFFCTNIRFKHAQYSKGCELYLCASSITQRHEMLKGAINPPWDGWNYCKLAAICIHWYHIRVAIVIWVTWNVSPPRKTWKKRGHKFAMW